MDGPSGKNREARELAPRVVVWESTRACRFACLHCRAKAQSEADPGQLSTQEAFGLVEQIAEFGKPMFIISGGDPLERTDIFEVARHAAEMGIRVVMSPSGSSLTPKVIEKMKESGVKMISVSLDGSNADIHDGFRQVKGAFGASLSNIGYAREAKLPFQVNTTVTKHNLQDLPRIMKLVLELGAAAWDVFMLVPTGRGKVTMEITPKQYEETMDFVYESSLKSSIPTKMTCSPHYSRLTMQRNSSRDCSMVPNRVGSHGGARGCMAGNGFCFISHVGEVFGCGFLPIRAGSIREKKLKEIYQESPLFSELRGASSLRGKCGRCEYKTVCGGCRARAFSVTGDYLQEEPYCEYVPKVGL